jgi:hypothetical protein
VISAAELFHHQQQQQMMHAAVAAREDEEFAFLLLLASPGSVTAEADCESLTSPNHRPEGSTDVR